jgi:hypothetical protein
LLTENFFYHNKKRINKKILKYIFKLLLTSECFFESVF